MERSDWCIQLSEYDNECIICLEEVLPQVSLSAGTCVLLSKASFFHPISRSISTPKPLSLFLCLFLLRTSQHPHDFPDEAMKNLASASPNPEEGIRKVSPTLWLCLSFLHIFLSSCISL